MRDQDSLPDSDLPHARASMETGFWGRQGAGCIVLSKATGRLMIALRSQGVLEPGTWGTWGGAVDEGSTPQGCVTAELVQETGYTGDVELRPLNVYASNKGDFHYTNFLAIVPDEFTPELNWENADYRWCEIGEFEAPLHFGLAALLADTEASAIIAAAVSECRNPQP